jgi:hypothetical protein
MSAARPKHDDLLNETFDRVEVRAWTRDDIAIERPTSWPSQAGRSDANND